MITTRTLTDLGIHAESKVLFIMPHPDDEAVFVAGLLHQLRDNHIKTRVITMTRGEKTTLRYGLSPNADIIVARKQELSHAFSALGVTDFSVLNFPDGKLETHATRIASLLKKEITRYKPTHVVTLEPDGIYGHPDHIALSRYTNMAVKKPVKLVYVTVSPWYILPGAKHMAKKKVIKPIAPDVKLTLGFSDMIAKLKAIRSHASQFPPFSWRVPRDLLFFFVNQMLTHEFYTFGN